MADVLYATCLVAVLAMIGGLAVLCLQQRRRQDAVVRTLNDLVEAHNELRAVTPEVPFVRVDPDLPAPPQQEAPPGIESLVLTRAVTWEEWKDEPAR